MNIFTATRHLAFVGKLFAAAKLNLDEFIDAGDETALQAALEARGTAAPSSPVAVTIDAGAVDAAIVAALKGAGVEVKEGGTAVDALKSVLAAKDAQLVALTAGLGKSGIVVKAADEKKGVQESDVTAAVDNRISLKAAELNGRLGTPPVAPALNNNPAAAPRADKNELKGLAKVQAAFAAETAAKHRRN